MAQSSSLRRGLRPFLCAGAILLGSSSLASGARANGVRDLLFPDRRGQSASFDPVTPAGLDTPIVRARTAMLDVSALAEPVERVRVELFGDRVVMLRREHGDVRAASDATWTGIVEGEPESRAPRLPSSATRQSHSPSVALKAAMAAPVSSRSTDRR